MDDIDIWRTGHLSIRQYGVGTWQKSARLVGLAVARGNLEG